jgi:hypothetical protein
VTGGRVKSFVPQVRSMATTILIGLHDPFLREVIEDSLRLRRIAYKLAEPDGIAKEAGKGYYAGIVMELNYGHPGRDDISVAEQTYANKGSARFLAVAAVSDAVKKAEERGIPGMLKSCETMERVQEFFDSLETEAQG